jgi:hypothetical protein
MKALPQSLDWNYINGKYITGYFKQRKTRLYEKEEYVSCAMISKSKLELEASRLLTNHIVEMLQKLMSFTTLNIVDPGYNPRITKMNLATKALFLAFRHGLWRISNPSFNYRPIIMQEVVKNIDQVEQVIHEVRMILILYGGLKIPL